MARGDEAELSRHCLTWLKKACRRYPLGVAAKAKILTDVTCIRRKGKLTLELHHSEVDIAVYATIPFAKQKEKAVADTFRLFRASRQPEGALLVPLIALELKSGAVTVDAIRARNVVAGQIRSMFPFCLYLFIGQKTYKQTETVLRHGMNFSRYVITRKTMTDQERERIEEESIRPHLLRMRAEGIIAVSS